MASSGSDFLSSDKDELVYSDEYWHTLKQTISSEYLLRKRVLNQANRDLNRVKTLDKTKAIFDAVFESFRTRKENEFSGQSKNKQKFKHRKSILVEKTFSFLYMNSKQMPHELKQDKENRYDLGCLIYLSNHGLTKHQLEVFEHLLGLNLCNNYNYSTLSKSVKYFFELDDAEAKNRKPHASISLKLFQKETLYKDEEKDLKLIAFNDFKNRSIIKTFIANLLSIEQLKLNNCQIKSFKSMQNTALHSLVFESSLKCLDLSSNQISDLEKLVEKKYRLEKLYLNRNKIETIAQFTFNSNFNLVILDLSHNKLKTITSGSFSGLDNLKSLNLSHNELKKIDECPRLDRLKILDLSYNKIECIKQADFQYLTELEKLILDHNFIDDQGLGKLTFLYCYMLKILSLKNNKLKRIDEFMFKYLTSLKVLSLDFNFIADIDTNSLPNQLEKLKLSYNCVERLGENFFQDLVQLKVLNLTHNELRFVNEQELGQSLQVLNLSHNQIEHFALRNFDSWTNKLKFLNLSHNKLNKIEASLLSNLNHNACLVLNNNRINELEFKGLTANFCQLHLESNELRKLELKFSQLKKLDLCNNSSLLIDETLFHNAFSPHLVELYLENLSFKLFARVFACLESLKILNLSNNRSIEELGTEFFYGLKNLEFLYVHSCSIRTLSANCFSYLRKLVYLDLSRNSLDSKLGKETFCGLNSLSGLNLSMNKEGLKLENDFHIYMFNLLQLTVSSAKCFESDHCKSAFLINIR